MDRSSEEQTSKIMGFPAPQQRAMLLSLLDFRGRNEKIASRNGSDS